MEAAGFSWQGVGCGGKPGTCQSQRASLPASRESPVRNRQFSRAWLSLQSGSRNGPVFLPWGRRGRCPGLGVVLGMGAPGRSASAQHPWLPEGSPHTPPEYLALPRPGPQHPLASVPSLNLETPRSASAPAKTLPKSHVVTATAHTLWCHGPALLEAPLMAAPCRPPWQPALPGCRDQLTAHPPRVHASVQGFPRLRPGRRWG